MCLQGLGEHSQAFGPDSQPFQQRVAGPEDSQDEGDMFDSGAPGLLLQKSSQMASLDPSPVQATCCHVIL